MNFYKFHLGDYYKKTSHLSMLEDGAYRRLMDAIYLREGPLPANREQVHRLVKAFTKAEKDAVDSVLSEFFTLTDAGYTNARCDEEIENVRAKSEKAKASIRTRWNHTNVSTNVVRTKNGGNTSHKPLANIVASTEPPESLPRARDPEVVPKPPPSQPVTNRHRVIAADLLDRGKADLSPWETKFLTDAIGRNAMNAKQQATFDAITAKIGVNMAQVMATWQRRMGVARKLRQWDPKWGPRPHAPGCLAPSELLDPDDGDGWTDWKPDPRATA
jgi:uncharacterized protein YdaU (DUF1376 family)